MSSKKRQTIEKFRREQAVRKRREDKAQGKAEARAAKAAGTTIDAANTAEEAAEEAANPPAPPPVAGVDPIKSGSGLREAPSSHVHQE